MTHEEWVKESEELEEQWGSDTERALARGASRGSDPDYSSRRTSSISPYATLPSSPAASRSGGSSSARSTSRGSPYSLDARIKAGRRWGYEENLQRSDEKTIREAIRRAFAKVIKERTNKRD